MTYGDGVSPRRETAGHMAAGPTGQDATAPAPDPTLPCAAAAVRVAAAARPPGAHSPVCRRSTWSRNPQSSTLRICDKVDVRPRVGRAALTVWWADAMVY